MKRTVAWLPKTGFLGNVRALLQGTVLNVAVMLASGPIISRIYTPAQVGEMAVALSLASLLVVFLSLRYEIAIPLVQEESTADRLTAFTLALATVASLVAGAVLWLSWSLLGKLIAIPSSRDYAAMLTLCLLASGWLQVLNYWAVRNSLFRLIGWTKVGQASSLAVFQIGFGLLHWGSNGLMLGYALSQLAASLPILIGFLRKSEAVRDFTALLRSWREEVFLVIKEQRNFAIYNTWAHFFDVVSANAPVFLLSSAFTKDVVGNFSMTTKLIGLPVFLAGQAVGQAFYKEIVATPPEGRVEFTEKLATKLYLMAILIFGILIPCGPELFTLFFGDQWYSAGVFARLLAPSLVFLFVGSPLSMAAAFYQRQRGVLIFSLATLLAKAVAIGLGTLTGSPTVAVLALSLAGTALGLFYFRWILGLVGAHFGHWFRSVAWLTAEVGVACALLLALETRVSAYLHLLLSLVLFGWIALRRVKEILGFRAKTLVTAGEVH